MRISSNIGTLKTRISVVMVVLVLFATSLVAFTSLYLVERQMDNIVGDQQFSILGAAAANIDQDLNGKKSILKLLAEELATLSGESPLELQQILEEHPTLRDEFFNVVAFEPGGALVANMTDRRIIGTFNAAKRAYFVDTIAAREGVVSAPFKSALSGKPVILITAPVYDKRGRLVYVLAGGIDLHSPFFFGQLEAIRSGKTGYLFMLTVDGTILHHPDASRILRRVTEEPGGPVPSTAAALKGFEGWTRSKNKRGVDSLIAYKRLRTVNWIVGAVYPVNEALAPLITMRRNALLASFGVALLAGLVGWLIVVRLLRPLRALTRHVSGINAGNRDISVFNVQRGDEFGQLTQAFYMLSKKREAAEASLALLAQTDALTGLHNRRMFEETLEAAIKRAARTAVPLGLAYLDIDHFKQINDTLGHAAGDELLIEFANRLRELVRSTDTVARLGGDEFVILFEHVTPDAESKNLGERIVAAMETVFHIGSRDVKITTSVGIAIANPAALKAGALVEAADGALYDAKSAGRNCYKIRRL
ncbi:MAG: diguanylate cyclase domain-containing protein [Telluria sp.]